MAMDLAESYRAASRNREANTAFERAWTRLGAMGRGETEKAGTLLNNFALVVRTLGQPLAAERLYRRAIEVTSAGRAEQSVSPMLLNNYAGSGVVAEARAAAAAALEHLEPSLGADHPDSRAARESAGGTPRQY